MVSFGKDVVPLFSAQDITCMKTRNVLLIEYAYMSDPAGDADWPDHANAKHVLARLKGDEVPQMPRGAPPWAPPKIAILEAWIGDGYLP